MFTFLGISGFAILRWATDPNVRYGGVFLITLGAFPGGPGFLSWALNNASGPAIRAVSGAYVVTLGTAGGVLATWYVSIHSHALGEVGVNANHAYRTYRAQESPKYPTGHTINLTGQIVVLFLSVGGILYCKWENRQRSLGKRDHRLNGLSEAEIKDLGYRHPDFRYIT